MLLGMMIRPSVQPAGENRQQENAGWPAWRALITQSWRFLACVSLLQGAHAAYYGFSAIYWQSAGYSASAVGYLWSLGVVAEVIIFALILHCGTFTVCHLAAMRYIAARQGSEVIRLQAVYSAIAMGGSIAIMTVFAGYLYQNLGSGVFWVMALVALPAIVLRPKVVAQPATL